MYAFIYSFINDISVHFIMIGIQYIFGVSQKKNKLINDTEDNNQTTINGHYSPHSSTPHHPKKIKIPLKIQLMNTSNDLYRFIYRKLMNCKGKMRKNIMIYI